MPKTQRRQNGPGRWLLLLLAGCLAFTFGCPQLQAILDGLIPSGNEPNTVEPNTVEPNDANTPVVVPGDTGIAGAFVGSTRCGLCHINTHNAWADTLHAGALDTLEAIGQDKNDHCIGCHVIGYGETGGFVDRATTNDLAGVGCEACHGGSRAHAENVLDESLRPDVSLASSVCGRCHTGAHHPTFDEWSESGHSGIDDHVAEELEAGNSADRCGICHSGDAFYLGAIMGEEVPADLLAGVDPSELNPITCAVCHDPHMKTNNAVEPEDGRDFQLRYPEVMAVTPSSDVDDVQDGSRFNLCGQCHHSRGREWTAGSRGPHHSLQSNVYVGEMPLPDGGDPLVFTRLSVHIFAPEQCSTCHMFRKDYEDEEAPAIAGHSFEVNYESCATDGCHTTAEAAETAKGILGVEMEGRLAAIEKALGDPATWDYTSEGGPDEAGQDALPDNVKQARFLYYYVLNDGSLGIHNPAYVREILIEAQRLAEE